MSQLQEMLCSPLQEQLLEGYLSYVAAAEYVVFFPQAQPLKDISLMSQLQEILCSPLQEQLLEGNLSHVPAAGEERAGNEAIERERETVSLKE